MRIEVELYFNDGRTATFRNVIFFSKGDTMYKIDFVYDNEICTATYNIDDIKYYNAVVHHEY